MMSRIPYNSAHLAQISVWHLYRSRAAFHGLRSAGLSQYGEHLTCTNPTR